VTGQTTQRESGPYLLVASALGAWIGVLLGLLALPPLLDSFREVSGEDFWHLSRITGWEAYFFLWASLLLGLAMTGRLAPKSWRGLIFSLHEFTGLLGMSLALAHALLLLGDPLLAYSVRKVFVPLIGQEYHPLPLALGQMAFYVGILTSLTFYIRRWLGPRVWRRLHYGTYLVFLLGAAHAFWAGADAATPAALWFLGITAFAVYSFTIYRIWSTPMIRRVKSSYEVSSG